MKKVAIVTDTTACIPQEQVEKYDIEVVPVEFIFGDKVYRDGIDMSPAEFYARLRQAKRLPITSGSSPGPLLEAYGKAGQSSDSGEKPNRGSGNYPGSNATGESICHPGHPSLSGQRGACAQSRRLSQFTT